MIIKKGNKTDRTSLMENAVYEYFLKEYSLELINEFQTPNGRADFGCIIHNKANKISDVLIFELKQSISDFYSGHGLNFVGLSNYLVVPSELVGFGIEFLHKEYKYNGVGVLEVTKSGHIREVIEPITYNDNAYGIKRVMSFPYHLLLSKKGV